MGMDISGVNNQLSQYYGVSSNRTSQVAAKSADVKSTAAGATVEISGDGQKAYNESQKVTADGKVTAKSADPYATAKMSESDRSAIVKQLQAEQDKQKESMMSMVRDMLGQQANAANGGSIWKFLASGNFTVDAQTKADAQAAISEDGFYGVKKTSERLFEFAQALAGDDVDKMKEMQKAVEKGFKMATGEWGRELPEICKNTLDAVNQKFEDYYNSKNPVEEDVQA